MASFPVLIVLYVFLISISVKAQTNRSETISLGSSLSPTTTWLSPSGLFAFGFHQQGNGFAVGIFMLNQPEATVVWTANRDDPPVSSNALLELTKQGKLILRTEEGKEKSIASASMPASSAAMLDSGNFVLYDNDSRIIWQSFNFPTDTILSGQNLSSGNKLISSVSISDHSSGRFSLNMQEDGNLVMYPVNSSYTPQDAYWSSNTYGGLPLDLHLNQTGFLYLLRKYSRYSEKVLANDSFYPRKNESKVIYRATLDVDGIFRLYSHSISSNKSSKVFMRWACLYNQCEVPGFCGFNSFCAGEGKEGRCYCYPGFDFINSSTQLLGCFQNFTEDSCRYDTDRDLMRYSTTPLENISWINYPYSVLPLKKEVCSKSCLDDCNCWVVVSTSSDCRKYKLPLRYGRKDERATGTAFFKVVLANIDGLNYNPPSPPDIPFLVERKDSPILILASSLGSVSCLCFAFALSSFLIYKHRAHKYRQLLDLNLGLAEDFSLQSFSYDELEKATDGFKEELGRGFFGAVYKGTLSAGNKTIAVKRLEKVVEEGIREFRAEMTTIGRTHHRNLVQLLGFCIEGSKKLLVYEFMSNGSLSDLLFKAIRRPTWRERVRFVLDVARGVFYLHEECGVHIIHCNLKPQNILLDDTWTAKISDFGLARLLMPNQANMSMGVEETVGYFAPEWQKNALISVKADIYSFGIVLLETVCCRRNIEVNVSTPDEIILSSWVYNCYVAGELNKLVEDDDNVDPMALERMVKVGLWCIQEDPALRPLMKYAILMLEGTMDIPVPPSPELSLASS